MATVRRPRAPRVLVLALGLCLGLIGLLAVWAAIQVMWHGTPRQVIVSPSVPLRSAPGGKGAATPIAVGPTQFMPAKEANELASQLNNRDSIERQDALTKIGDAFQKRPETVAAHLANLWLKPLAEHGYNQEIADWTLAASLCTPSKPLDLNSMETILEARVHALLAEQKNAAALSAAKSYYNFVRLKQTPAAADLVVQCLKADPKTATMVETFQNEQAAGAQPSDKAVVCTVLQSIKVDSTPYDEVVELLNRHAQEVKDVEFYHTLLQRGNRLLLADKPLEVRTFFEQAYNFSSGGYPRWFADKQVNACAESVARTIRAEDGTPARALGFLAAVPKPGTATTLPALTTQPTTRTVSTP